MTTDSKEKRFRSAPPLWRDTFKAIVNDDYGGEAITYEMIEREIQNRNYSITRESLRVKMARYVKSGYARPVIDRQLKKRIRGAFWLTEKGKLFFGLTERTTHKPVQKTAVLPTPPSKWGIKALNINQADAQAK